MLEFKMKYDVIKSIDLHVADSFVKENKTLNSKGNGEARLYIGPINKNDWNLFFENFKYKVFFKKSDLDNYLNECKFEYEEQNQRYRKDISSDWFSYKEKLKKYDTNILFFDIHANNGSQDENRFYIKSNDEIFKNYFRSILLPNISWIKIEKIKTNKNEILYYFYPYLNFHKIYNHPNKINDEEVKINQDKKIEITTKEQLIKSRRGQGNFRNGVVKEFQKCMFSNIDDVRILNASHIKPWIVCDNNERLDSYNGFLLSPTYDKLFDLGFFTFDDDSRLIVSTHLSSENIKRLFLENGKVYNFKMNEDRKKYLEFHRTKIFKK